ncbi:MAG: ribonucleoside triphosphate reductase [Candidatus Doudnabacteria bacterium]
MAKTKQVREIKKRDGRIVPFEPEKVATAIFKAAQAVGGRNRALARQLAAKVVILLNEKFDGHTIPSVEQIQDLVEKVLIEEGHAKTAKAYILYRDQHARLRDLRKFIDSDELMEGYLSQVDWRVRENSNMTFSLQGLNNHVASSVSSHYWLHKIYPPEVRDAHLNRDFHIHDLQLLSAYCTGWDLRDLLMRGFGGVSGKIESHPPKHLRAALGQIVNFFYTVQGEIAGAVAFSNFDTYLAPFIRYDDLSYGDIKQCLQEFLFNMNVPTRVGFQCLSGDTEILTSEGWRGYSEVKAGDEIKTFNLKNSQLEEKKVTSVFKRQYQGVMYNLKNRIQDQLISHGHRVVRKLFSNGGYVLEPIEAILKLKSPFIIPVAGKNANLDAKVSDDQIQLLAWVISEGSIERPGKRRCCYRVSIYQSKFQNRANYNEIINLLKHFKLHYSEYLTASLGGEVQRMRMDAESSRVIHKWFGTKENIHFIPACLQDLSERQARLFLDTYLKADGFEGCKIATTDLDLLDQLQIILVQAGYGFTVMTRKPTIGQKDIYVLRIIKHPETYIARVKKVNYHGVIWSVHTENETVIARRKGKVFITGNTPFTNITLDLTIPANIKNEPVVIGGKLKDETYGRFQKEMDFFNRAFGETMLEGDAKGRVFSFPIPTINITRDFQWGKREWNPLWEVTAKYGVPYFANFVNSDMSPDDARSMCCRLRLDNRELRKRGGGLFGANPLTGSIGVVTINMPRLGYIAKDKEDFFKRLGKIMAVARKSLQVKREALEQFTEGGLYPYCRHYLDKIKESFGEYWRNHFNTIGLLGMNEACLNLLKTSLSTNKGHKFAKETLVFMRERLMDYQNEENQLYNLEATPAEGTSYNFAKYDKEKYPKIIVANERAYQAGAKPYYTNSTHLPVNFSDDLFEALDCQDDLQSLYTGGTVLHGFIGERLPNITAVKSLVKKVCHRYHLPYFTLTPTFSICPKHGYIAGEHEYCPKCDAEIGYTVRQDLAKPDK